MTASKKPAGLAGIPAGETAIALIGNEELYYRGYLVKELADKVTFDEVAFLLIHGHLPVLKELDSFQSRLRSHRSLPENLKAALRSIPQQAHPMDVMRTGCSMLGALEPETSVDQQEEKAERLLGSFPSMLVYWYRFSHDGIEIDFESSEDTVAGYFLDRLHDAQPTELQRRVMNVSLILYAENEFNASTFAARICTATLSDLFSAICAGIGTLRGPLHGGANKAAMELIENFQTPDEAEAGIMEMLANKKLIMGFGHRVYTVADPRSAIFRFWSQKMSEDIGDTILFPVSERIESVLWREKKLFPNVDFFAASVFHFLGIPTKLFTTVFALARISGWSAHVFEQRSNNRLIRPLAEYVGPAERKFVPLNEREGEEEV